MQPTFLATLFTESKTWKQLKCSSMENWVKKMWYMYTTEYYSATGKDKTLAIGNNMDGA